MRVKGARGGWFNSRGVSVSKRDGVDKNWKAYILELCVKEAFYFKGGKEAIDHHVVNTTNRSWLVFNEFPISV